VFYRYTQINVGGCFIGPQVVLVEAASLEEAEARAAEAGVYFDGVAAGLDCECCGDRWTRYPDEFNTREEAVASIEAWRAPEPDSPVSRIVDRPVG
jgi:hypothetical protein